MSLMPRIRRAALAGALALLLAAPSASAGAGVELKAGDKAVDFVGKEFINGEATSLKDLRGRLVLLELFSTG